MKKLIINMVIALVGLYPAILAFAAGAIGIATFNPIGLMFLACAYIYVDFVRRSFYDYRKSLDAV